MRTFISILILIIFCACSQEVKEQNYKSKELEIDFPMGWKMTDKEDFGAAKYFAIEQDGLDASGVVTISFVQSDYDLEDWINLNIKKSNLILFLKKQM